MGQQVSVTCAVVAGPCGDGAEGGGGVEDCGGRATGHLLPAGRHGPGHTRTAGQGPPPLH